MESINSFRNFTDPYLNHTDQFSPCPWKTYATWFIQFHPLPWPTYPTINWPLTFERVYQIIDMETTRHIIYYPQDHRHPQKGGTDRPMLFPKRIFCQILFTGGLNLLRQIQFLPCRIYNQHLWKDPMKWPQAIMQSSAGIQKKLFIAPCIKQNKTQAFTPQRPVFLHA